MSSASKKNGKQLPDSITRISVEGFKSIYEKQGIDIRPLTILAGPNSSGKSSIIQPLLLLKQTLEAAYDPGALLLDGPNLKFTRAEQLLSTKQKRMMSNKFLVEVGLNNEENVQSLFFKTLNKGFDVYETVYSIKDGLVKVKSDGSVVGEGKFSDVQGNAGWPTPAGDAVSERVRCFLKPLIKYNNYRFHVLELATASRIFYEIEKYVLGVIHLPGLRGNPLRTYPVSAVGKTFPGTFENYVATVLSQWKSDKESGTLEALFRDLKHLGLTWKVEAKSINDTQVEIQVGRLPKPTQGGARDLVSIADVGFGVSQTLPVVVALHAARPGQLVYLEQPEIHLHPRAQTAMAEVLARAAQRGVKVVVETHSSLLLLGVQTLVAEGKLSPDLVKLHWFQRNPDDGATTITSADLDADGRFGPWPVDFADVSLDAQDRYLDAVHSNHGM